jgi:hypothetical protein
MAAESGPAWPECGCSNADTSYNRATMLPTGRNAASAFFLITVRKRAQRTQRGTEDTKESTMRPNEISYKVIGAAMAVHSALGAGLLESAYEKALCHEFTRTNLQYRRQVQLPVEYGGVKLSNPHTGSTSSSKTASS